MTKVISLSDDAYEILKQNKLEGESFSEVVRKIAPKKKSLLEFAGILKDKKVAERIKADISEGRKKFGKSRNL